jgi:uncharacterized protein (DUF1684 family)
MTAMRILRTIVVLASLAGLWIPVAGCRPAAPPGAMVSIPPPVSWGSDLAGFRRDKDDRFRVSPDSPLLQGMKASFAGLEYFAPSAEYHFVGPVNRYRSPERLTMITTSGNERPSEKYGWIRFPLDGETHTLQVYRMLDSPTGDDVEQMFVPFADSTTGTETYPAGRYVNLRGAAGGPYVLDFNAAYNPSCAYGDPERFACPRTPAENRLSVRIEAGERGYEEPAAADG